MLGGSSLFAKTAGWFSYSHTLPYVLHLGFSGTRKPPHPCRAGAALQLPHTGSVSAVPTDSDPDYKRFITKSHLLSSSLGTRHFAKHFSVLV